MKKIYTSYYANIKKLPEGFEPVAISVGPPKWFDGLVDKRMAPTWVMMKKPRAEYDRMFTEALNKLDAQKIFDQLPNNAVLLCYEKPNDWCHRRAVAEWFEKELGIEVCEFGLDREQSFDYKDCTKENAGKLRTVVKEEEKSDEPSIPESVRMRRQSMEREEEQIDLFSF